MRRIPAIVWILLPLAIGLLYAAGHALVAPRPTLANVAPAGAILVHRVRGLDMFDLTSPGPRAPGLRPPREALGRGRNNPNLLGVDAQDWVHLVLMPRTLSLDSTMAIFRTSDGDAFEREFMRTDFLERHLIRHAQHLYRSDPWVAVGPNRDATRRIGTGSLACADLGEDWSMVADVPRLIDHALQLAKHDPWRSILATLGLDVAAARMTLDPKTKEIAAFLPGDRRIQRIRSNWRTIRLWAWHTEGRLRVDLEPTPEGLIGQALSRGMPTGAPRPSLPPPPARAEGWLRLESQADLPLVANTLLSSGVRFVAPESDDPLGGLGKTRAHGAPGLLLWAARGLGTGYAWSLGLTAPAGELPDLTPFLPLPPAGAASLTLPKDAAPLTIGDTTTKRKVPAGTVERALSVLAGGDRTTEYDLVTFGPGAKEALEEMKASLAKPDGDRAVPSGGDEETGAGMRRIASFFLRQRRAEKILGRALRPGGFLAMLANGDVRGALYTDGRILRLLVRVER